jgi:hypothetical protein
MKNKARGGGQRLQGGKGPPARDREQGVGQER